MRALSDGDGAIAPISIVVESLDNPGWSLRLDGLPAGESGSLDGSAAVVSYGRASELSLALHTAASLLGRASEPSPSIDLLVRWYLALCDGDWEHTYGATIRLVDTAWRAELRSDGVLSDRLIAHLRTHGCEIEQVSTEWADEWTLRMPLGGDQAQAEQVLSLLLDEAVNTR